MRTGADSPGSCGGLSFIAEHFFPEELSVIRNVEGDTGLPPDLPLMMEQCGALGTQLT